MRPCSAVRGTRPGPPRAPAGDGAAGGSTARRELLRGVLLGPLSIARHEALRLPGHELGEGDVGAGEGARCTGIGELHDAHMAATDDEGKHEQGSFALRPVGVSGGAGKHDGRAQIGDHQPASAVQDLRRRGSVLEPNDLRGGGQPLGAAVCGDDAQSVFPHEEGEHAGGGRDAIGGDLGQHRQRRAQKAEVAGARGEGRKQTGSAGGLALATLRAKQSLDVGAPVAPVSPGAAEADQLAGVTPSSQGVEAHAECRRRLAEAQPVLSVGFSYAHSGGLSAGLGTGKLPQFCGDSFPCRGLW